MHWSVGLRPHPATYSLKTSFQKVENKWGTGLYHALWIGTQHQTHPRACAEISTGWDEGLVWWGAETGQHRVGKGHCSCFLEPLLLTRRHSLALLHSKERERPWNMSKGNCMPYRQPSSISRAILDLARTPQPFPHQLASSVYGQSKSYQHLHRGLHSPLTILKPLKDQALKSSTWLFLYNALTSNTA